MSSSLPEPEILVSDLNFKTDFAVVYFEGVSMLKAKHR
jgi:hypothetical protein